jgi:hypothetical protein
MTLNLVLGDRSLRIQNQRTGCEVKEKKITLLVKHQKDKKTNYDKIGAKTIVTMNNHS